MSDTYESEERRASDRIAYRTVGFAVTHYDAPPSVSREVAIVWTENFGMGGTLVICKQELPGETVLLKLLLPQLGDTLVECKVIHFGMRDSSGPGPQQGPTYWYGLKFGNRLSEGDLDPQIRSALSAAVQRYRGGQSGPTPVARHLPNPGDQPPPLMPVAQPADESEQSEPSAPSTPPERKSLIPFLSAIGLVVVYANLLFA